MRFKLWQWITLGVFAFITLALLTVFIVLVLSQSSAPSSPAQQTSVAITLLSQVTLTPAPTATPTPRPTNTRVVVALPTPETPPTMLPTPGPDDYFPLAVGYRWVYRNDLGEEIVRTVTEMQLVSAQLYYLVEEQAGTLGTPTGYWGEYRYQVVGKTILLERFTALAGQAETYTFDPFQPILKMPLKPGSGWTWSGRRFEGKHSITEIKVTWEAYPESVRIPAGIFDGYRVTALSNVGTVINWYAPGVGLIGQSVAGSPHLSFKLVEYQVGQ